MSGNLDFVRSIFVVVISFHRDRALADLRLKE
jgi:hypothetical protein